MSDPRNVSGKWLVLGLGVLVAGTVIFVLSTSTLMRDEPPAAALARMPRTIEVAQLPEPESEGAMLLQRYCTSCHGLPDPAQHLPQAWPGVLATMEKQVHSRIMRNAPRPSPAQWKAIEAYLQANAAKGVGADTP